MLPKLRTKKSAPLDVQIAAPTQTVVVVVRRPPAKRGVSKAIGMLTFLAVPGLFLASSIPALAAGANAFGSDEAILTAPVTQLDGQSVAVTTADAVKITRGAFTADTHAQVMARKAARARAGAYSTVGPRQAGDDYPWRNSGGGLSPLGYVERQCTDFVAWRINRDHGATSAPWRYVWANLTPNGGSASRWASAWSSHGWKTSHTPVRGAVAYFGGHVAYVKNVNSNGTVFLEEYNWNGSASYHTRTIAASSVSLFLYPPP